MYKFGFVNFDLINRGKKLKIIYIYVCFFVFFCKKYNYIYIWVYWLFNCFKENLMVD